MKTLCVCWSRLLKPEICDSQPWVKLSPKPHVGSVASGFEGPGLCPNDLQEDWSEFRGGQGSW